MDPQTPRSRRAFLAGGAAAAAAWAASLVGKAVPEVAAASGSNVILGSSNSASQVTTVTNTSSGSAVQGVASGSGAAGVAGSAGSSSSYGVFANGRLGVTGPIEMTPLTLSNYSTPSGKAFLYVRTVSGVTELRVRFPSGADKLVTSSSQ